MFYFLLYILLFIISSRTAQVLTDNS